MINNNKFMFIKLLDVELMKLCYIVHSKNVNIFCYQNYNICL